MAETGRSSALSKAFEECFRLQRRASPGRRKAAPHIRTVFARGLRRAGDAVLAVRLRELSKFKKRSIRMYVRRTLRTRQFHVKGGVRVSKIARRSFAFVRDARPARWACSSGAAASTLCTARAQPVPSAATARRATAESPAIKMP